jgi:hypothetical protein
MNAKYEGKIRPSLPSDPAARIAWLEAHGPCKAVVDYSATADLRVWAEAPGVRITDEGGVDLGSDGCYNPAAAIVGALDSEAEERYIATGETPVLLDEDVVRAGRLAAWRTAEVEAHAHNDRLGLRATTIARATVVKLAGLLREHPAVTSVRAVNEGELWQGSTKYWLDAERTVPLTDLSPTIVRDARELASLLSAEYERGLEEGRREVDDGSPDEDEPDDEHEDAS